MYIKINAYKTKQTFINKFWPTLRVNWLLIKKKW
jgi:hypothetical protein